jgi:hypothetical protein
LINAAPRPAREHPDNVYRQQEQVMIEMLEGFPKGVVAAVASGRVTREDYNDILVPAIEAAFARRDKVRCY